MIFPGPGKFGCGWLCAGVLALAAALGRAEPVPVVERGLPLVRNFAPRDYGSSNQVWCSAIARDGTMFFSTQNQVAEFDGLTWSTIPVPNTSHVRAMAIDADDVLWIGGVNELGRIVRGADGRRRFESLRKLVPQSVGDLKDIWCVYATQEGVWFQSNQAVLRWRDGKFDVWMMNERAITLSFWLGDHLLVARLNGWYRPLPGGGWQHLGDPAAHLGDYLPHFMLPHPGGGWFTVPEGPHGDIVGAARWDGTTLKFEPHPLDPYFKSSKIYSGIRLHDGRYVMTSLQGGAVVLGPDLSWQMLLNEQTGLPADTTINAIEDAHGAVWLGTEFGISRVLLHPAYTMFGAPNGLARNSEHPSFRWQDRLLVGGSTGILQLRDRAEVPSIPTFDRLPGLDDKVNVFAAAHGELMIGAVGGVWHYDGRGAERVRSLTNTFDLLASRKYPNILYAASINGLGIFRHDGTQWKYDRLISEARGVSLHESSDGLLWIGTDGQGVLRVEFPGGDLAAPPKIVRYNDTAGLPRSEGKVRICTAGGEPLFLSGAGMFRFDAASQSFVPEPRYGRRFVDGSLFAEDAVEDAHGGLWVIAHQAGATEFNTVRQLGHVDGERWQEVALPNLERLDGISRLRLETQGDREILWVGCDSLVLRVDLTAWRANGDLFVGPTLLHDLRTSAGEPLAAARDANGELQLRPAQNSVRFRFGTPGLAGEPDVRHETRLVGFGDGAVELGASGERTFTNLPAGDYRFEVRGRSADGRWSEPASRAFRVLAPWWQTAWAWAGGVVLLGLATYGVVRRRTHALERERARLEAVVSARTAELAEKNRDLERLNRLEQDEKLSARLAEEKARLELLRYQLNPHFLFNSLNSIRALVYANPDAAGEMVTRLAEFCRWTLTRGSDETTTVADEAEMVRTYLDIEKARWQDALIAQVEIDEKSARERLPQFLLLPLIENAIKYGGRTSPGTLGVNLTVRADNGALVCEVANTGTWVEPGSAPAATSTHIGLENLRERLTRHYGAAWTMDIRHDDGWVRVQLRFPRGLAPAPATDTATVTK